MTQFDICNTVAEITINYSTKVRAADRPQIRTSQGAAPLFLQNWQNIEYTETFKIMLLNKANQVLGICQISSGGIDSCIVDIRTVFATALKANAVGIICCHNHPSGCLKISDADKTITHKLVDAGKILGITILDHIILTKDGFESFADSGLL